MIYTLMYHHMPPEHFFDEHLSFIAKHFQPVHPGEAVTLKKHGVCITFDDAYADFMGAFKMIEKYGLKVTLGVPTSFIGTPGYLTWDQIKTLTQSPLFHLASHSHTHVNLNEPCDLEEEIMKSKRILEAYGPVDTFIFPFGKFSKESLELAKHHYKYVMRIGSAINKSWDEPLIYRIPCDHTTLPSQPFNLLSQLQLIAKHKFNRVRLR